MSFRKIAGSETIADPSKFGNVPVFTDRRVAILRERINAGLEDRQLARWSEVMSVSLDYMPGNYTTEFNIPGHYTNPDDNAIVSQVINSDLRAAADLALRYAVTGNELAAQAAARVVNAWANIPSIVNNGDSRLVWSNRIGVIIQAARMLEGSAYFTEAMNNTLKDRVASGLFYSTANAQTENRAMWGVCYEMSAASYLGDEKVFRDAIYRWRELFSLDIKNNVPVGETEREANSLYYCNFWLNPATQAAEIARFNGEWLYDYKSRDGSTLKGLWDNVSNWTANPETFHYWPGSSTVRIQAHVDPLHALWPNEHSQKLIDTYTTTQDHLGQRNGLLVYRGLELRD